MLCAKMPRGILPTNSPHAQGTIHRREGQQQQTNERYGRGKAFSIPFTIPAEAEGVI